MTHLNPQSNRKDHRAEKARMLMTILGNEYTRKSTHPFFRSLTETAASPSTSTKTHPDISRALKNLMSHLATQQRKPIATFSTSRISQALASDAYVSSDQHPALIASSLAKMDDIKRRCAVQNLGEPLATRVLVYLREIESKSALDTAM